MPTYVAQFHFSSFSLKQLHLFQLHFFFIFLRKMPPIVDLVEAQHRGLVIECQDRCDLHRHIMPWNADFSGSTSHASTEGAQEVTCRFTNALTGETYFTEQVKVDNKMLIRVIDDLVYNHLKYLDFHITVGQQVLKSDDVYEKFWLCQCVQDALGAADDGVLVLEVTKVTRKECQDRCSLHRHIMPWNADFSGSASHASTEGAQEVTCRFTNALTGETYFTEQVKVDNKMLIRVIDDLVYNHLKYLDFHITVGQQVLKSDDVYEKFWLCQCVQDALGAADDGVLVLEVTKITREEDERTMPPAYELVD